MQLNHSDFTHILTLLVVTFIKGQEITGTRPSPQLRQIEVDQVVRKFYRIPSQIRTVLMVTILFARPERWVKHVPTLLCMFPEFVQT